MYAEKASGAETIRREEEYTQEGAGKVAAEG
jgi:hypothetical protein